MRTESKSVDNAVLTFTWAVKQAMAIDNIRFELASIRSGVDQAGQESTNMCCIPSDSLGWIQGEGKRHKITVMGFEELGWLEAPIWPVVTCLGGMNIPCRLPFCTEPVDNDSSRILYLQSCLHQRGVVSAEMGLRVAARRVQDVNPVVRFSSFFTMFGLLLWCSFIRTRIHSWREDLHLIEDTVRTAIALVRAEFPSFQIEL